MLELSAKKTLRFISVRFFQCRRRPDDNSQARHSPLLSLSLSFSSLFLSPSCRSTSHILSSLLSPIDASLLLLYFTYSLFLSLFFALSGPTERTNGLRPDARIEPWSIELCLLFVPVRHSSPAFSPFRRGQSVLTI